MLKSSVSFCKLRSDTPGPGGSPYYISPNTRTPMRFPLHIEPLEVSATWQVERKLKLIDGKLITGRLQE